LPKKPPRRLFLDDDPERASAFLEANQGAVWVQTVPECVEKLAEPWDEVHLDHDLGGEHYVDTSREDCGMEVVRWLANEPRHHLRRARFTVHSHNMAAAFEMVYRIRALGYRVEARPFRIETPDTEPFLLINLRAHWLRLRVRARNWIRRARGLWPLPEPVDADPPDDLP
jgi:hypothetical protein